MKNQHRTKRFTKKDATYTLIAEEWDNGQSRFQSLRQVEKGTRQIGNHIMYGCSPLSNSQMWNFGELAKHRFFNEWFYIDHSLSYSEKCKKRKELNLMPELEKHL